MDGALSVIEASRSQPAEKTVLVDIGRWPLTQVLGSLQAPARKVRIEQAIREAQSPSMRFLSRSTPRQTTWRI